MKTSAMLRSRLSYVGYLSAVFCAIHSARALDNGLALTPPMGEIATVGESKEQNLLDRLEAYDDCILAFL